MKKLFLVCLLVFLTGCSLIGIEKSTYTRAIGDIPQEKGLSFESKEALAAGATLANMTAANIYFKGTKPESTEAKIVYDMSYRFLGLAGVNARFDPSDPESVKKVFEQADKAIEEKDKAIHQLQEDVKQFTKQLAEKEKIVKDRGAELESQNGKWRVFLGNLWFWIWFIIVMVILAVVGLGVAQVYTGIPFLKIIFTGGGLVFKGLKQTVEALQPVRDELKALAEKGDEKSKALLEKLDMSLHQHQDERVKKYISKIKEEKLKQ